MHEDVDQEEFKVVITPALDTDGLELLKYLSSKYKGVEENTKKPTTTAVTSKTQAATNTTSDTTSSALNVGSTTSTTPTTSSTTTLNVGPTTNLFLLISSLAMMYSKM